MIRRLLLGAALGAFFLWLALRNVSFGEIAATLRGASVPVFCVVVLMHLVSLWVRAVRWRVLMRPIVELPTHRLVPPLAIGFMVNFLFPGRAGEVVRAWLLGRREQACASATFATVVVERLFDGLAIFCFLAPAPFLLATGDPALLARIRVGALALLGAYLAVLTALVLLGRHRELLAAFLARHPAVQRRPLLARGAALLGRFCEGLAVLDTWRPIVATVLLSLLVWGWGALANALMMHSIGLSLPAYAPFFLVVLQGFGVLIPSPGFVGPFQYAHVVALGVYGVPQSVALSLALLIHAATFAGVLAPGFWYAAREHVGLRDLSRVSRANGE